jgi:hypothetical protein
MHRSGKFEPPPVAAAGAGALFCGSAAAGFGKRADDSLLAEDIE